MCCLLEDLVCQLGCSLCIPDSIWPAGRTQVRLRAPSQTYSVRKEGAALKEGSLNTPSPGAPSRHMVVVVVVLFVSQKRGSCDPLRCCWLFHLGEYATTNRPGLETRPLRPVLWYCVAGFSPHPKENGNLDLLILKPALNPEKM